VTPPPKVVADRLFDGRAWTVTLHKRQNGTTFWQLTELAGSRTDWPVVHPDGTVVFDHPERLPARVREWARRMVLAGEIGRGLVPRKETP